jgi:hypothetical protein
MLVSALLPDKHRNQNTAASINISFDLRAATQWCPSSAQIYYSWC